MVGHPEILIERGETPSQSQDIHTVSQSHSLHSCAGRPGQVAPATGPVYSGGSGGASGASGASAS